MQNNNANTNDAQKQAIAQLREAMLACTKAGLFVATTSEHSDHATKLGEVYEATIDVDGQSQPAVVLEMEDEAYEMDATQPEPTDPEPTSAIAVLHGQRPAWVSRTVVSELCEAWAMWGYSETDAFLAHIEERVLDADHADFEERAIEVAAWCNAIDAAAWDEYAN